MDISKLILKQLDKKGTIKSSDIVKKTNFSRTYINRFFKELMENGKIILIGKANKTFYVKADKTAIEQAKKKILSYDKTLINKNLSEDLELDKIKNTTGIFIGLKKNITDIFNYAFTEILNNAIEHSRSDVVRIKIIKKAGNIKFEIIDKGIGIFNNIMQNKKLNSELEAIQDLLKGRQTTMPEAHSGEGIFFTSKAADNMIIEGSNKKLIFNNLINDIFIRDIKKIKGTKVVFVLSENSSTDLGSIFKKYTNEFFEFKKTSVLIKLYKINSEHISRSQGRRIISGLEKFNTIYLDFNKVDSVGQAFVDEIFRIWKLKYPDKKIIPKNMTENVAFMVKRVNID